MIKKIILLVVILAVIAGLAIGSKGMWKKENVNSDNSVNNMKSVAIDPKTNKPKKPEQIVSDIAKPHFAKMKLTAEQQKLHDECIAEFQNEMKPVNDQRSAKNKELGVVMTSKVPDEQKMKKVDKLTAEIKDLNKQEKAISEKTMTKFVDSLNPSQKKEYEAFVSELEAAFNR